MAPVIIFSEGIQTGVLSGTVTDAAGRPLPAVEVRVSGPQGLRVVLTDDFGQFRLPALTIGSYDVSAFLLDLRATSIGHRVYIDKTTEIALRLLQDESSTPKSPADQIRVLASAPLIDRLETRIGASVSREFLEDLPLVRFYQSGALLLPGVEGGENGNPNVGGSLRTNNLFLVDGVDTTDPTTGLFGLNLAYEAVHDIDIVTAASPIEYGRVSGAIINAVTRSGTNLLAGSARWLVTPSSWVSRYQHQAPELQLGTLPATATPATSLAPWQHLLVVP